MKTRFTFLAGALILALVPVKPALAAPTFTYTTIDVPGAVLTVAVGINNSGQIVGVYQLADGSRHGFLFTPGIGFATIDDPNATSGSEATGINNSGQIVRLQPEPAGGWPRV